MIQADKDFIAKKYGIPKEDIACKNCWDFFKDKKRNICACNFVYELLEDENGSCNAFIPVDENGEMKPSLYCPHCGTKIGTGENIKDKDSVEVNE